MRIKNNVYTLTAALVITLCASCTKTLDLAPVSSISVASFWKTQSDAEGALAGMYVQLRAQANLNLFVWGEGRAETMEWGKLQGTLDFDRYYLNLVSSAQAGPTWGGLYSIVNTTNLLLKYVPGISFTTAAAKDNILAQAYTMRAFCYFVMARTWGDVPLRTEPVENNDPAVVHKERAPLSQVFQLIREDLDAAVGLYPSMAFAAGRNTWNKAAAYALMSDVYLWTGKKLGGGDADFTVALNACTEAQKADVTLLPSYSSIFAYSNKGNKEILMAVRFQQLEHANNYFENMYIAAGYVPANVDQATRDKIGTPGGLTVWTASELARGQFTTDDQRRDASFLDIFTPGQGGAPASYYATIVMKGRGVVENGVRAFRDDIILYRHADVLLMKAEAKNALRQDPSAEINEIRKRAYGAQFPAHVFTNGSQADNDAAILKERMLELAFEGKRWWDLVRFNKAFEIVPSLQGRGGETHLLVFPIANSLLSLEPKVTQTEGYD